MLPGRIHVTLKTSVSVYPARMSSSGHSCLSIVLYDLCLLLNVRRATVDLLLIVRFVSSNSTHPSTSSISHKGATCLVPMSQNFLSEPTKSGPHEVVELQISSAVMPLTMLLVMSRSMTQSGRSGTDLLPGSPVMWPCQWTISSESTDIQVVIPAIGPALSPQMV